MNLAIAFVIYNPEKSFLDRIRMINNENYHIFIFDNSPEDSLVRTFSSQSQKIHYFTSGKNVGLGFGLSVVCSNSYYENFDFLLFFDQDTFFKNTTLKFAQELIDTQINSIKNFAAISLNSKISNRENLESLIIKKDLIISSGSIFNLKAAYQLKWHNTNFFVDNVDYEFCLRAVNAGYFLGECTYVPDFDHVTGQEDKAYFLFNKKLMLRSYSKFRVINSIKTYFSLFSISLSYNNYQYLFLFIRSFIIFIYFQILVRILNNNFLRKKQ